MKRWKLYRYSGTGLCSVVEEDFVKVEPLIIIPGQIPEGVICFNLNYNEAKRIVSRHNDEVNVEEKNFIDVENREIRNVAKSLFHIYPKPWKIGEIKSAHYQIVDAENKHIFDLLTIRNICKVILECVNRSDLDE